MSRPLDPEYIESLRWTLDLEATTMNPFDFDHWMQLAQRDPEAFERLRAELIEEVIASSGVHQARLRGLQWLIDQERRRSRTPMKSCLRLSSMMWDSLLAMRDEMEALMDALHGTQPAIVKPAVTATIIQFPG